MRFSCQMDQAGIGLLSRWLYEGDISFRHLPIYSRQHPVWLMLVGRKTRVVIVRVSHLTSKCVVHVTRIDSLGVFTIFPHSFVRQETQVPQHRPASTV